MRPLNVQNSLTKLIICVSDAVAKLCFDNKVLFSKQLHRFSSASVDLIGRLAQWLRQCYRFDSRASQIGTLSPIARDSCDVSSKLRFRKR